MRVCWCEGCTAWLLLATQTLQQLDEQGTKERASCGTQLQLGAVGYRWPANSWQGAVQRALHLLLLPLLLAWQGGVQMVAISTPASQPRC